MSKNTHDPIYVLVPPYQMAEYDYDAVREQYQLQDDRYIWELWVESLYEATSHLKRIQVMIMAYQDHHPDAEIRLIPASMLPYVEIQGPQALLDKLMTADLVERIEDPNLRKTIHGNQRTCYDDTHE